MTRFDKLKDEKKENIIRISMKEFAEYGYELASTNRIVSALGISKGSLFKYFDSKLQLYKYLVDYAASHLNNYLEKHLNCDGVSNWRDYLFHYASIEYDFLINEPLIYLFFRTVVKDIDRDVLSEIKADLLKQTNSYLLSIRKDLNIENDLFNHLFFIIEGYNEYYLNSIDHNKIDSKTKEDYLTGLKKHFDYVKEK